MKSDKEIFVEWLKHAIKIEKVISGKELAEAIGISGSTISGWFGSKSKGPKIETRLNICKKLGVSYNSIIQAYRNEIEINNSADEQNHDHDIEENEKEAGLALSFKQTDLVIEINRKMLLLEMIDEKELEEIHDFVKFRLHKRRKKIASNGTKQYQVGKDQESAKI